MSSLHPLPPQKTWVSPQNYRRRKGGTMQVRRWVPKIIRDHRKRFSRLAVLAPGICVSMAWATNCVPTSQIQSTSPKVFLSLCVPLIYRMHSGIPSIVFTFINHLNVELNPICCLLALLGANHFLHVSRIKVKSLNLRLLMSYIYIYIYIYIWSTHSWCF